MTLVPAQIVVADAAMVTLAGRFGLTTMAIAFDVAGEPVKQGLAFDVNTHVTASLFAHVVDVKVAVFEPTFVPLTFH